MRAENGIRLRKLGIVALGVVLLGLVLACSLFNQLPVARIVADALSGASPLVVTFDASTSTDADGTITAYLWDFGDGHSATGEDVVHTFTTAQAIQLFTVTLTVMDNSGASGKATQTIEVRLEGEPATGTGAPTARMTATPSIGVSPLTVTFDGSDSTPGSGSITAYSWNFADGVTATGPIVTHTYSPDPDVTTSYPATLYVHNSNDEMDAEQINVIVIVPENDPEGDDPTAEVTITGPDIIYESTNRPNVPSLFEVSFDPRGSKADAGHSLEYFAWDFGDGNLQVETSDLEITHIYELTGATRTIVAKLTIFDNYGLEDTAVVNITLSQPEEET